jgi:hypothetical protein
VLSIETYLNLTAPMLYKNDVPTEASTKTAPVDDDNDDGDDAEPTDSTADLLISAEFDETMSVEELVKKSKDIEDRIEAINGNLCDIPESQKAPGRLSKRRSDLMSILSSLRKRIKEGNALKQPEHSTKDENESVKVGSAVSSEV